MIEALPSRIGALAALAAASASPAAGPVQQMAAPLKPAAAAAPGAPVTPLVLDAEGYAALRCLDRVVLERFPLGGGAQADLVMERFDVLADDARVVIGAPGGDVETARPDVVLLRGRAAGDPGSWAFLGLSPHGSNGIIVTEGARYIVAAGPAGAGPVVYDLGALPAGLLQPAPFVCGLDQLPPRPAVPSRRATAGGGDVCLPAARIAVETNWEFTEFFDGDTAASGAYALMLMGAVSSLYEAEIEVPLQVVFLRLWSADNDPWEEDNAQDQLFDFKAYWESEMQEVARDAAHFLTTMEMSGAGGVAFLPGLCEGEYAYGLSAHLNGTFPFPLVDNHPDNWDVVVVSHELGHNFGAPHTHSMSPPVDECAFGDCSAAEAGTIMSYCHLCEPGIENIVLQFHERIKEEEILPFLAEDLQCALSAGAPVIIDQPDGQTACESAAVTLAVTASGEPAPSYQWRHNGSPIAGETAPLLEIQSAATGDAGLYDVVVSNTCGEVTSDQAQLSVVACCQFDLSGDGNVGVVDMLTLLMNWGTSGPGDFDGGGVGVTDFLLLLLNWGPC